MVHYETRSSKEIAANALDMEMHRLAGKMERFAAEWLNGGYGENVANDAYAINGMRTNVRLHMHPKDREETV